MFSLIILIEEYAIIINIIHYLFSAYLKFFTHYNSKEKSVINK